GKHRPISMLKKIENHVYPELPSVLELFAARVKTALGKNLVGLYLVGSLATGDFDLDSDVDFLTVINQELNAPELEALNTMHRQMHILEGYPAKHLEGSYISLNILNRSDLVGVQPLWYVDNGSTTLERSVHDNQWHVRWILRERGIVVSGPDPKTLLDEV